jgi:hypothetical protein
MNRYQYHRIAKLEEHLRAASVSAKTIGKIMEGGEDMLRKTDSATKAGWMRTAMLKMDQSLDLDIRKQVREGCACCLGGKRLEISRAIARENHTLASRISAASRANLVFGHSVTEVGGEVLVHFAPGGQDRHRCVCLPKAEEPISITYCYCCGGHVKHHLQIALGEKLDCEVASSALSSGGKEPCVYRFRRLTGVREE